MTRAGAAVALALLLGGAGCAAALPVIVTAAAIASEAVRWIDAVADFVAPRVDADHARAVSDAVVRARAAAAALEHAARGAQAADGADVATARRELEAALAALFRACEPYGVRQLGRAPQPTLGARPDGTLGVPSACEIVRGAEACGA